MSNFLKRALENVDSSDLKHKIVEEVEIIADWIIPDNICDWHLGTTLDDRCGNKKYEKYDYCINHLCEMIDANQSQHIRQFKGLPFVYRNAEENRLFKERKKLWRQGMT